jgi:hypothetical protein
MPSRFAPPLYGCNGANDASAEELVNSLLSSYEAFPGGSNLQRKECEAAIDYDTPFSYYLWWSCHVRMDGSAVSCDPTRAFEFETDFENQRWFNQQGRMLLAHTFGSCVLGLQMRDRPEPASFSSRL